MDKMFLILWLLQIHLVSLSEASNIQEYCNPRGFNPSCDQGEVIVMAHAQYGMIRVGNCIDEFFSSAIGCTSDEMNFFDRKCSGLKQCNQIDPEKEINARLSCLRKGFFPFLEAGFFCQKVITETNACSTPKKIKVDASPKYISSESSRVSYCGLQSTPYILEADAGQQINVTLVDFAWSSESKDCFNYGYVLDTSSDDVISICGHVEREKQLLLSSSKQIQILLETSVLTDNRFLIRYHAVGCPDHPPPEHGWIQRDADTLTVGCYSSDRTWQVKCVANQWIGHTGSCDPVTESSAWSTTTVTSRMKDENHGVDRKARITTNHVVVVTIGCITLISCSVVIIVGVYCIRRYQKMAKSYTNDYQLYTFKSVGDHTTPSGPTANPPEMVTLLPTYTLAFKKDNRAVSQDVAPPPVPYRNTLPGNENPPSYANQQGLVF